MHALCSYEPPHEKKQQMICAPSEDSVQPGHPLDPELPTDCTMKTLIRQLGKCPWLGAQVILLVLQWVAHVFLSNRFTKAFFFLRFLWHLLLTRVSSYRASKNIKINFYNFYNWAGPWENVSYVICKQQRPRSACASAQSDQRLCCLLLR